MSLLTLPLVTAALLLALTSISLRFTYIFTALTRERVTKSTKPLKTGHSHLVVVLGSGGHTAEMMALLRDMNPTRYFHRTYIVSSGDAFSQTKAREIEKTIQLHHRPEAKEPSLEGKLDPVTGIWDVKFVPRARKIHQPIYTTPFSSLWCLVGCVRALLACRSGSQAVGGEFPDVVITNGPATAVIIILATLIMKFFGVAPLGKMKTIYVESWARVKTLSLSGKVLLRAGICDRFLVQWEALAKSINGNGPRQKVEWVGLLVA